MEITLDKRFPVDADVVRAWSVLRDVRAVAACMPGAQITEQIDDTHYKGTVRSKVGPAVMSFGGDIEVLALDAATYSLQMLGKGADKAGSSASMKLTAHIEPAEGATSVLVGQATVAVSGKLAQFGGRLLVPVSDAMLAQFADNFRAAAAAVPVAAPPLDARDENTVSLQVQAGQAPGAIEAGPVPRPALPPAPVKELNALALMWTVLKNWIAGLFGRRS